MKQSSISILKKLQEKYSHYLKNEIIEVAIIQTENGVYLESVELEILQDGLEKQTVYREDLDFILDDDESLFFDPIRDIEVNAKKFIEEYSLYSIINTTDLFHEEACTQINKKYNIFGIDI